MSENSDSPIKMFSYTDDQPQDGLGVLIPRKNKAEATTRSFSPQTVIVNKKNTLRAATSMLGILALAILGTTGYGLVSKANLASTPAVVIMDSYTQNYTPLDFGPQQALSNINFFKGVMEAFIDEEMTFMEVDLSQKQIRFFKNGVLFESEEILSLAEAGSWWETPAGFYKIEKKEEKTFTNIGQVYLPWVLTFQGNYLIHGWPSYPDSTPVKSDFKAGGIRLSNEAAEKLYKNINVDMPILVHATKEEKPDTFVYEPQVIGVKAPNYFIADIDNATILAATDLNTAVPIASLTKLMTAVVASEKINLDGRIKVTSPTFVTSLIPRLAERSSVSMYSLLQLLLVESSNEAAETIAGEIGRAEFIEAMNAKARQLGMMNTQFADPSGLSSENVSSLGDLYTLTKYIYDNRSFIFEITNKKELVTANVGGEFNGLVNFNEVKDMDSFIGGKVGETIAAGQTSISLHKLNFQGEERVLMVIILGSDNRTKDIETLISYVQNRFGR